MNVNQPGANGFGKRGSTVRVLAWPGLDVGELNPYTRLLYQPIQAKAAKIDDFSTWRALVRRYDIFHLHWPTYYVSRPNLFKAFLGSLGVLFLVLWCRLRGAKVVWTVHNLESHRQTRPRMERIFFRIFTSLLDGYIALTELGSVAAQQRFPSLKLLPGFVIQHGHYRGAYPGSESQPEARKRLGIPATAKVILFFGCIAPYKDVPALVAAFRSLKSPNAFLYVAGVCSFKGEDEKVRRCSDADARIRLRLEYVPKREVPCLFAASDLVVLPFTEILNSGSALLALSFDRPLLVPAKGGMPELRQQVGPEWVRIYEGRLTPVELDSALDWATSPGRARVAPLDTLDWNVLSMQTLDAYRTVIRGAVGRAEATACGSVPAIGGDMRK